MKKTTLSAMALSAALFSGAAFSEVAVIVNPANSATITDADIKKLFLGKSKKFPGGDKAILARYIGDMNHGTEFNEKYLGKSDSQAKAIWSRLLFTGKVDAPEDFEKDADVIQFVKENPGAIGFVSSDSVTSEVKLVSSK